MGQVERGSHHSLVTSLSVIVSVHVCVCVNACALWTVTVQGSLPFGSCDRQHTEMVRGTHSGARLPGLRPSSAFPS